MARVVDRGQVPEFLPYIVPLLVAGAVSVGLTAYVWRQRHQPGARAFALLLLALAVWSLADAGVLAAPDLAAKSFWYRLKYLGVVVTPTAFLVSALQATDRRAWVAGWRLAWFAVVPAITLLLVWTSDLHRLMWTSLGLRSLGPVGTIGVGRGPWFFVNMVYSYAALALALGLRCWSLFRSGPIYRRQALGIVVATLVPLLLNVVYNLQVLPLPRHDLTPFTFTLSGLALTFALFRYRLLDLVPVAHDAIFQSMSDGVLVLDARDRIVDANPAAQRFLGRRHAALVGQPIAAVLPSPAEAVRLGADRGHGHAELVLGEGAAQRHYDLRSAPRQRRGALAGRLVVLRDITERRRAEEALRASEARFRLLAENAQDVIFRCRLAPSLAFEYVSPAVTALTGYAPEQFYADPYLGLAVVHPDDRARFEAALASGAGLRELLVLRWRHRDGRVIWIEQRSAPVCDPAGRLVALEGVARDITARKLAEEALAHRALHDPLTTWRTGRCSTIGWPRRFAARSALGPFSVCCSSTWTASRR